MEKILIEPGTRFGKWTAIKEGPRKRHQRTIVCRCECGEVRPVIMVSLRHGSSTACRSCGSGKHPRHGMADTPTYTCWLSMKRRCCSPKDKRYASYGGRGIVVCDRWMLFDNFLSDMGIKPDGLSLDRINNDGNYEPGNCRWATDREQRNNKSVSRLVTWNGKTMCCEEWCRELGFGAGVISNRLRAGWSVPEAMTTRSGEKRSALAA